MTFPVLMMDCVADDVPALHARYPGRPVAGYVTGGPGIEWTEPQFDLWARKVRICQQPADAPAAAEARVIDVERGAARAADVSRFISLREQAGHDDATVYCSLETVPAVLTAVQNAHMVPRWWLAWWWNRPGHPSAAQVLGELQQLTGVALPPASLWGTQFRNHAQWDTSVIYGPDDFSRH